MQAIQALTRYSGAWGKLIHEKTWSQKSCGTVSLNFLLHVQHCTKWNRQILAVIPCQLETISYSHGCESTKRSPPHTHTLKWRKYILRAEGRILRTIPRKCSLWPKSDESKKSLVLFYLFTLWRNVKYQYGQGAKCSGANKGAFSFLELQLSRGELHFE